VTEALSRIDWTPVWLTLRLAATATLILLALGTPLAWWLARSRSRLTVPVEALIALPLVLPPTVVGFYLLVLLGPSGPIGFAWESLLGGRLVFSFGGLLLGSIVHTLPFVVQPLVSAFRSLDVRLLEAAAVHGAAPLDRFVNVVVPLCRPAFLAAGTLGFAHVIGEFGVVLMIGGNIRGETELLSIAIYERVEMLDYAQAHVLSAGMLAFSALVLMVVYWKNRPPVLLGP
jgi:molybdate transport system permease protein